jgi:hypothetical protein
MLRNGTNSAGDTGLWATLLCKQTGFRACHSDSGGPSNHVNGLNQFVQVAEGLTEFTFLNFLHSHPKRNKIIL